MNINKEKEYIYNIISELTLERRKLTEERMLLTQEIGDWKNRLNELNNLEEKGMDNLDIMSFVELKQQAEKNRELLNVKRETENIITNINEKIEVAPIIEQKEEENVLFTVAEQEKQKDREARNRVGKTRVKVDEKFAQRAVMILKENGIPTRAKALHEQLEKEFEVELEYRKFANNVMRLLDNNPKISKPMRGFYQYNF